MKTRFIKNFFIILLLFISIFFSIASVLSYKTKQVEAKTNEVAEIVMEKNTNRVLYEKNASEKKYMASTTKILTAIIIIENCDLEEKITIKKETVGIEGSSIYLEEGEILTVKELLYGLMLRSGNDCAETLAVHCSGSISKFADKMNETAKKIGSINSNFVNPHGLHDDNHYTTAYDLALISCYALKNDIFKEIVGTKQIKISHTKREYDRILTNKNKLLSDYNGATGIKTGYTKKAGRCLVSSAEKNGMELITVVLNCPPMFERSKELLNNAFDSYSLKTIVNSSNIIGFVTGRNQKEIPIYIKEDIRIPLNKKEVNDVKIEYEYPKNAYKKLKKDDLIGFIKIFIKNNLIFQQKIYIMLDEDF